MFQTEFMVDMTCEGCVNAVKNKLETIEGSRRNNFINRRLFGYDLLCWCLLCVMEIFNLVRY